MVEQLVYSLCRTYIPISGFYFSLFMKMLTYKRSLPLLLLSCLFSSLPTILFLLFLFALVFLFGCEGA